jgi:hypothetical protein
MGIIRLYASIFCTFTFLVGPWEEFGDVDCRIKNQGCTLTVNFG